MVCPVLSCIANYANDVQVYLDDPETFNKLLVEELDRAIED